MAGRFPDQQLTPLQIKQAVQLCRNAEVIQLLAIAMCIEVFFFQLQKWSLECLAPWIKQFEPFPNSIHLANDSARMASFPLPSW